MPAIANVYLLLCVFVWDVLNVRRNANETSILPGRSLAFFHHHLTLRACTDTLLMSFEPIKHITGCGRVFLAL